MSIDTERTWSRIAPRAVSCAALVAAWACGLAVVERAMDCLGSVRFLPS